MYSKNAPFRYDFVGSFLRPAPIKAARAAFAAGELDAAGLKEVEDREIRKLISRQKAAAYRQVIADLYAAGCRNVQLDDCTWGMFCDAGYQQFLASTGAKLEDQAEKYLQLNNAALEGKPADLVVTTHVCRGNYHSTWASSGGYAPIAPILFAKAHVDGFYLEFDDARSGDFAPLQFVAPGKKVVLGLVTTKSPVLEDPEAVKARIAQAAELVPLENLCLSPQCGFASCEIGNKLTDDEQWAKLDLVRTIARQVW